MSELVASIALAPARLLRSGWRRIRRPSLVRRLMFAQIAMMTLLWSLAVGLLLGSAFTDDLSVIDSTQRSMLVVARNLTDQPARQYESLRAMDIAMRNGFGNGDDVYMSPSVIVWQNGHEVYRSSGLPGGIANTRPDIGEKDGRLGAAVYVGGGMGRTPMIAPLIKDFVPFDDFVSYLEACLRVYNRYGRRDNMYKARIKILIHELGAEKYAAEVEEEFAVVKALGIDPPRAEFDRIAAHFAPPPYDADAPDTLDRSDPDFAVWLDQNVSAHKQPGHAVVTISLKPIGGIPGDASADQIDLMADLAQRYSFDELRVTHAQNIVLPHVRKADLHTVWQQLREAGLAEANLDLISDIIACPGLDYCSLANARSIPLAQKIATRFSDIGRQRELGELKLKISGCINACGHHHAGHIGILGVDRKGVENYQLLLGGSGAEDVSLGTITGPGFSEDGIVDAIEKATDVYLRERDEGERFLDTYRRVGMAPFKEAIYG